MIQSSSRSRRKAGYLRRLFDRELLFVPCITNNTDGNRDANNGIYANSVGGTNNAFYTTKPFRPRL
jgi:hypothetical protein